MEREPELQIYHYTEAAWYSYYLVFKYYRYRPRVVTQNHSEVQTCW